tara:strand:- start:11708 stop:12490 length:783 start_codon:yes stop_codon:yes gene_type:complete
MIKIDYREKELIKIIENLKKEREYNCEIEILNLDLGDIIICDKKKDEKVIIERKTLQDLASSIRDRRYNEQSYRLNNCNMHNHHIIYLLEGDIHKYKSSKYGREISKNTLFSTMTSLLFKKGFSLYKSLDCTESAEFILQMTDKLSREKESLFYDSKENNEEKSDDYIKVSNRVKKNNITPDNIGEIMLCQIPSVSDISAKAILNEFKTIDNLIKILKENPNALYDIKILSKEGKTRKLTITCRQNIYNYLLNKSNYINI